MISPLQETSQKEKSSFRNMSYSKRDTYYRKAKEEGFRARSVYKLKEIHQNYNILSGAKNFVDLCAAPGSWSQMLRILTKNTNANIVAVDIQDIVPIEGVHIVKGDITRQETIEKILAPFNKEKVDIVIFDGAPDVTGLLDIDMYLQVELIIFSVLICMKLLKENGKFVAKLFKVDAKEEDEDLSVRSAVKSDYYYEKVKSVFDNVFYFKPASSRASSHETYIVCEGFAFDDEEIQKEIDGMSIEDIFEFEKRDTVSEKVKAFLRMLIKGSYI